MKKQLLSASFLTALLVSSSVFAQTPPPSTVLPGRVGSDITKSLDTRHRVQTPEVTDTPIQSAPEGADKIMLELKQIVIKGNKTIDTVTLENIYASDIGKTISLKRIYAIANEITNLYRNSGYILSRAIVPKQEIKNGIVTIQIIEGFIDGYTIQGETRGSNENIRRYADKIVNSGTLSSENLERYLLLMNDLPGIDVRAVLSPSQTTAGAATLTLITSDKRVDAQVTVDNLGNEYLGPLRTLGQINFNSLAKSSDKTTITYLAAPSHGELSYFQAAYSMPIGYNGLTVGGSLSYTLTSPTLPASLGGALDTEGESSMISLYADYPIIRGRSQNFVVGTSFDYSKDKTNYAPAFSAIETEDRLRILKLRTSYSLLDSYMGYNNISAELSQGLRIFNSTEKSGQSLSRSNGDDQFTKINFEATRTQTLHGRFSGLVGVTGQMASDSLLASQEFGFGGPSYGRGYDNSEITGDNGIATKLELLYSAPVNLPDIDSYQAYVFYDFGQVWNKNISAGDAHSESAASAGIGTRVTFSPRVSGNAYIAAPLTRKVSSKENNDPEDGDDIRFKFSLTAQF